MNVELKELPVLKTAPEVPTVLMVGNPNAGKTSLFNALTGLRAKTANYPGVTVEYRQANVSIEATDDSALDIELIDLPGLYSMHPVSPDETVAVARISSADGSAKPAAVLLILDATNLARNLYLAEEVLQENHPTIIALNMIDIARSNGTVVDLKKLSTRLNCPIVAVSARTGEGIPELKRQLAALIQNAEPRPYADLQSSCVGCTGCPSAARHNWAERICRETVKQKADPDEGLHPLDRWLTSPYAGSLALMAVMLGVFFLIFSLADFPMAAIENGFGWISEVVNRWIPAQAPAAVIWFTVVPALVMSAIVCCFRLAGIGWNFWSMTVSIVFTVLVAFLPLEEFRSLVIDGVIGGIAGVLVFLPQIVILFFFIALLEDSGYLARAAFVMERWMRRVGLPGKAFVPMLSAHACAIPGIMATRTIETRRDRMVTILVLPLLTCSARLPVYAMISALLFAGRPLYAALTFAAAYLLGLGTALATAFVLKQTVFPGEASPLVIELPSYRVPALRNALLSAWDRAVVFLKSAGTIILLISVILWALATYPRLPESNIEGAVGQISSTQQAQRALEYSAAGRLGRFLEPVFEPLGFDWKINVGVVSSFAAREVLVSTLSVIYGVGEDEDNFDRSLVETLRTQKRADGRPVFTTATSFSLLVFYVLAMQCLPTQVVTCRETGSWKWAIFQFVYMTVLAWIAAALVFQLLSAFGLNS